MKPTKGSMWVNERSRNRTAKESQGKFKGGPMLDKKRAQRLGIRKHKGRAWE